MKTFEIANYRMIKVSYVGPTNSRGSRVKIWESPRYNDDKQHTRVLSYDYATGDVLQQAVDTLEANGFKIIARASERDNYVLLCDNWGDEFIEIESIK